MGFKANVRKGFCMKNYSFLSIVSLIFVLLLASSIVMHFLWKSLIQSKCKKIGVVEGIKKKTSNGSTWYCPIVTYCIDGKTYTNQSCISKIHSFEQGQEIHVRYIERFPRFSVVCDNSGYLSKPFLFSVLSTIIVYVYSLILIRFIIPSEEVSSRIIDILLITTFLVLIVANFISEWRMKKSTNLCKAKIIFSEEKKNQKTVIAEYILDNVVYQTREMSVPLATLSTNQFNVDNEVMVRYFPSRPYHSMIADDIYSFKKAKVALILATVFVFFRGFLYLFLH